MNTHTAPTSLFERQATAQNCVPNFRTVLRRVLVCTVHHEE